MGLLVLLFVAAFVVAVVGDGDVDADVDVGVVVAGIPVDQCDFY